MVKHIEKTEKFDPYKHLRCNTEIFICDDKVVGERVKLQCMTPGENSWYTIPTHQEYNTIYGLENLRYYSDIKLRPGVEEELEALKEGEDD